MEGDILAEFFISCTPTAQARPKVSTRGGFVRAYKTKRQQAHEKELDMLLADFKPAQPWLGGLEVEFTAYLPIPSSDSKKTRADKLTGAVQHTKKPDVDNLAKQLLDAMTRLEFWSDDAQICGLFCRKRYAAACRCGWDVIINRVGER